MKNPLKKCRLLLLAGLILPTMLRVRRKRSTEWV